MPRCLSTATRHGRLWFSGRKELAWRSRRRRSGPSSPDAARSGRRPCLSRGRVTSWCARCTPPSAAEPRRSSSPGGSPPTSRGPEPPAFPGRAPADMRATMRAPYQQGELPGPVTYGYLNVGVVEAGPTDLLGRTVFALHPHQPAYVVPASAVTVVPEHVPARRAVLAGTVETAVNALWDAAPLVGDRVAVVGAGMVGCCVARLLALMPGVRVTLVDVDATRAVVADRLGAAFAGPDQADGGCDLV